MTPEEQKQFDEYKDLAEKYNKSGTCPNCGYCPCCGRRRDYPINPVYPWPQIWS